MKRLSKIGLTDSYNNHQETQTIFRALLTLQLLPMADIRPAFDDVNKSACYLLQKLLRYVERQWITKSTVGPQRLSVRDNPSRTNNVLESFHSALRSRVKVIAHPNVFAFQRATVQPWTARPTFAAPVVAWQYGAQRRRPMS